VEKAFCVLWDFLFPGAQTVPGAQTAWSPLPASSPIPSQGTPLGWRCGCRQYLSGDPRRAVSFCSSTNCTVQLFSPDPALTTWDHQRRLSASELMRAALWQYPHDRVVSVGDRKVSADVIAELWLEGEGGLRRRLLNPYSGAEPISLQALGFLRMPISTLLGGHLGRVANGIGSPVMVLLSLSGAFLWLGNLKRSRFLSKRPAADLAERARKLPSSYRRVDDHLRRPVGRHRACFAFPLGRAQSCRDFLRAKRSCGRCAIHSGSAGGWFTKTLWTASGLSPPSSP
jgi:hypothetical protein